MLKWLKMFDYAKGIFDKYSRVYRHQPKILKYFQSQKQRKTKMIKQSKQPYSII